MLLKHPHSPRERPEQEPLSSASGAPLERRGRFAWAPAVWILLAAIALAIAAISWGENFRNGSANAIRQAHLKQPAATAPGSSSDLAPADDTPNLLPSESPGARDLQVWKKGECKALREELARIEASLPAPEPALQQGLLGQRDKTLDQLMRLQC